MLNKTCFKFVLLFVFLVFGSSTFADEAHQKDKKSFTLWQLPSRTPGQNMSYVLKTSGRKIIVVDGGNRGDAEYLKGFLAAKGNHVHAWFISHPHPDHVDALTEILKTPDLLHIEKIYGSIPEESWVTQHEPQYLGTVKNFNEALQKSSMEVTEPKLGEMILIDDLKIEILGIKNPEIHPNAINNSSIVFRVSDSGKSVLFTGDLGVQGGQKLLASPYRSQLKSDYVQMAHHGQNGVDKEFYSVVEPKYCLWPTPAWLWNNDSGKGINSGTWQTLIVRDWMDELKVPKHYLSADGLIRID